MTFWVFLFQTIDAECVKWASLAGTYMYVKAFIVNVNKCLKPFFLEQHINIVNIVTLQSVWFICTIGKTLDQNLLVNMPLQIPIKIGQFMALAQICQLHKLVT